jgi:hypothetical protein
MPLEPGSSLGAYTVTAKIGEGGPSTDSTRPSAAEVGPDPTAGWHAVQCRGADVLTNWHIVAGLTALEQLYLNSAQITDAGLAHLAGLPALRVLFLDNTSVTGPGLAHLTELAALEELFLSHSQVTDAGVAELQKALPNCRIFS